jgi:hypothetical protein
MVSVLDSTAKLEAGILVGNLASMGNFDECIGVTDVQTELGAFRGKHCLASLTWANDTFRSTKKLFDLIKVVSVEVSGISYSHNDKFYYVFFFRGLLILTTNITGYLQLDFTPHYTN